MKHSSHTKLSAGLLTAVILAGLAVPVAAPTLTVQAATGGRILYVKPDYGAIFLCTSWKNACPLQIALALARSGDEIWVQAGVYKPTIFPDQLEASFILKTGVAVYGGFAGTETSRRQRDWEKNVTVLSGDIGGDDLTGDHGIITNTQNIKGKNTYNVVGGWYVDASAILDGFTITGGYAPTYGGGMSNWNGGSPTLNNLVFTGNWAGVGGGIFNFKKSNPTLTNVTFVGNSAHHGGGMGNNDSSPILKNVIFKDNTADNAGGMINSLGSKPTLTDVLFSGNKVSNKGGAMENGDDSNAILTNVTFENNSAAFGGAVFNGKSDPVFTHVTFSGNKATRQGGGMMNEGSWPTLDNVTFVKNTAGADGGGILNHSSRPTLTNVTFSGNSAVYGGGLCNTFGSYSILVNVTITGNKAAHGSGMASVSSNPTLTSTIIWGNTPLTEQIYNDHSKPVITYSDIERGYTGTGNMMVNPRFDALADNGGLVMTHALQADSLLIDKGNPDEKFCPQTDPRGIPRPYDGNADGEARCDIGAFEYLPPGIVLVSKLDAIAGEAPQNLAWRVSIQDLLKLVGLDHRYAARRELATKLGCPGELLEDSARMNSWLHKTLLGMLEEHGGNIPQELLE